MRFWINLIPEESVKYYTANGTGDAFRDWGDVYKAESRYPRLISCRTAPLWKAKGTLEDLGEVYLESRFRPKA